MAVTTIPQSKRVTSTLMAGVCAAFAVSIVVLLALVTGYLLSIGIGSLTLDFFTKDPTGDVANPGGMRHAIFGTVYLIGLAAVVGIPIGMLTGVFLSE